MENNSDLPRHRFSELSYSYSDLTKDSLRRLRTLISTELKKSGLVSQKNKANQGYKLIEFSEELLYTARLICKSQYFGDRESIRFNECALIGFCEWADFKSQKPIVRGLHKWLAELAVSKSH